MEPLEHVVEVHEMAVAPGERAALVVEVAPPDPPAIAVPPGVAPPRPAEPQSCAIAEGLAAEGGVRLGLYDAALATWMAARYGPLRAEPPGVARCDGLPPVAELVVPPSGWVIGLRSPALEPAATGSVTVHPVGDDRRWWHLHADGPGDLVFPHAEDPPTRLEVRVDEALIAPAARTVGVPRGGAALVDLDGPITHAEVAPEEVARLEIAGDHLVVLSSGASGALLADAVVRVGDGPPEPLRIEIGAAPGPDAREVRIRVDGRRRITVDTEVRGAWIAAPDLATAEVEARTGSSRITLHGRAPGRTTLVIDGVAGPVLVPLAVGG